MRKNHLLSQTPEQRTLIEPPVKIDFAQLLAEAALSENEQGIVKRRLLENRDSFGNVLQRLLQWADKEGKTLDIPGSLKELEKEESREIKSFDSIAKILSRDFPELLQFILSEYQVDATQTRALIGKEFVFIKRIADVIFEATDKQGCEVIIHIEFERQYHADSEMDKRKLEYRHLMEMDEDFEGKTVLCNVFYLRGSPADKEVIEERHVKLPTTDTRYSGELKYKAYHLSLMTIDLIIERNLPFLLPFIIESELQDDASPQQLTRHISSLKAQIDQHEQGLTQMIQNLSPEQLDSLRTTVEYLWGKSYSHKVFNQSNLLKLMREQLNSRQSDVQRGIIAGRNEGINAGSAAKQAQAQALAKQMAQEGKMTQELVAEFLKRLEARDKPKDG